MPVVENPVAALVGLYVLSGCDYVSALYGHSKEKFLRIYMVIIRYIGNLVDFKDGKFEMINEGSWIRLVCALFFNRHAAFFTRKPISEVFSTLTNFSDASFSKMLLQKAGYPSEHVIDSMQA